LVLQTGVDIGADLRNCSVGQPFGCRRCLALTGTFCIASAWPWYEAIAAATRAAEARMPAAEFKIICAMETFLSTRAGKDCSAAVR
jgi:hypothetical protein